MKEMLMSNWNCSMCRTLDSSKPNKNTQLKLLSRRDVKGC